MSDSRPVIYIRVSPEVKREFEALARRERRSHNETGLIAIERLLEEAERRQSEASERKTA